MHQSAFALFALAAGRGISAAVTSRPAAARRPERVAAMNSEAWREVSLFTAVCLEPKIK